MAKSMTDSARYTRQHKLFHVCRKSAEEVHEMYVCMDCGERMCPDHSEVLFRNSAGRPSRICTLCRIDQCSNLLTCDAWNE